jgi:hypothetical protein
VDDKGRTCDLEGIKFETFIFDALPFASTSVTLETLREEEFAPVNNPSGKDSLESAILMQNKEHRRWLLDAGIDVAPGCSVEISPLFALGPQEIKKIEEMFKNIWIGFCANITYPKAQNIRDSLAVVNRNNILLETDAPYLPPQEFR